jgi:ribosome biogenesis GTPase A
MAKINWFPGHMAKATRQIGESMKNVDLVFEIRDARIPVSSVNDNLNQLIKRFNKPRVILLNKSDLAAPTAPPRGLIPTFLTDRRSVNGIEGARGWNTVIDVALSEVRKIQATRRSHFYFMIVGMPNVGKSTIINTLRSLAPQTNPKDDIVNGVMMIGTAPKSEAVAKVGKLPGVTLHISKFLIRSKPIVYMLDSPGIMVPNITDERTALRLALTGAIKDSVAGELRTATYLHRVFAERVRTHAGLVNARARMCADVCVESWIGPVAWR